MSNENPAPWINPYPHVSEQNPYWHVDMHLANGSHEQIPVQNLAAAEVIRFAAFDK